MNPTDSEDTPPDKARHGTRSEVSWDGGSGRQPYENQEEMKNGERPEDPGFAEGDRGELSGRNLDQLEQVKKKP